LRYSLNVRLVYCDEAGDDGYPRSSSKLFALSSLYVAASRWRDVFEQLRRCRRQIKANINLPVRQEIHTRDFLVAEGVYQKLRLSDSQRRDTLSLICECVGQAGLTAGLRIVNVVIRKPLIIKQSYQVLDTAITYSVQRVKNDIGDEEFMVFPDDGRPVKTREIIRRIQAFNIVPSKYGASRSMPIKSLIEDPVLKDSRESYFLQFADTVVSIVYWQALLENGFPLAKRIAAVAQPHIITNWLDLLKPALNTKAAPHPYGFKYHP
jgi:Protein of unknown function (DUF3800)